VHPSPAGAIQFSKTGSQPTATLADIDSSWLIQCGQVTATRERFQELRASQSALVTAPTLAELEEALHQPIGACELQHRNWRNRVYRVELGNGTVLTAKQVLMGTDATVRRQFDELEYLSQLQVPGLQVPKPVALLPEKRILIMEFVRGETITALLSSRARAKEGLRACELAGAVLARLHRGWEEAVCPLPVEQLAEDMATAPWRLSRGQKEILRRILAELTVARVSVGRMHYDYEPDNLLLDGEQLFVVDPSAGCHRGIQLFEVATFRSALRRRLSMRWVRQPSGWRRGLLDQAIAQFHKGYLAQGGGADLEPRLFTLAVRFFELQRLGQMFVGQKEKIDMARQKGQFGWQVGGPSMHRGQLGLLDLYKGWLFRQLARQLRSAR
jgi:hypothetical protein